MAQQNQLEGYQIVFGKKAQKQLEALDGKSQQTLLKKLKTLVDQDHCLDVKKLHGYDTLYRIKVGDYRIVYEPLHKIITIHVIFVGQRKKVYQEFMRYYG